MSHNPEWSDENIRELALRVRYFFRKKFTGLDRTILDDLEQEVMQATHEAAQQQRFEARQGARFETFVLQIARHKAADYLRLCRRRRQAVAPLDLIEESLVDVEGDIVQADLLEKVKLAVDQLNERHAEILRLHFYQNLKIKEIAQQLGVSEQEVSNLKSYALRKVREILEKQKFFRVQNGNRRQTGLTETNLAEESFSCPVNSDHVTTSLSTMSMGL
ncbi:MAG: sigma-70 family RNA polymerase sigma factor [candidate division KSB1 bacterium]|nr:sigma-70 family RNA polymerase sigma factor [candidate division KSB1 bacterium]MDZ7364466.1 sigma-70 family RNA polymerase sigma factor [candidate division KSB1 bacterium]MDZ7402838.1 sigma-70 family RNA polymerase sigma factor [candidate division KSB1 bacterium]